MRKVEVAWGITGAGAFMTDVLNYLKDNRKFTVDVFLSKAAEKVTKMYGAEWINKGVLPEGVAHVFYDRDESYLISGRFSIGYYRLLIIAPVTSNSVAKMVYGVADTLITNIFAQAAKSRTPIIVLPSDVDDVMISYTPAGSEVKLFRREIDYRNILLLEKIESVRVVHSFEELIREIETRR